MFSINNSFDQDFLEKTCERVLCDEVKNDLVEDIKKVKEDKRLSAHCKNIEINKLIFKALLLTSSAVGYPSSGYCSYDELIVMEQRIKSVYTKGLIDKKAEIEFLKKKLNIKSVED